LIEHGPHWISFIIFSFISENIDILNAYIKFGTKLFIFTFKKKEKFKTCHKKSKKGEFECFRSESLMFERRHSNRALMVYLKQVKIIEYVMSIHYKK